jgi:hypothetical protein
MHISHHAYMPRKKSDENLTKVVSSIISVKDLEMLEKYAKVCYTQNLLKLPTISHMVRYILNFWAHQMRMREQLEMINRDLDKPGRSNLSTTKNVKLDKAMWDRFLKGRQN